MNKTLKLLGTSVVVIAMITLAFAAITHDSLNHMNHSGTRAQSIETSIIGKTYSFNMNASRKIKLNALTINDFNRYDKSMDTNPLDRLQYLADMSATRWYITNYFRIPSKYRGISKSNDSIILSMWEHQDKSAIKYIDAMETFEMNQHHTRNKIDANYVMWHREGVLISNTTIEYHLHKAFMFKYKYSKNNESLVYAIIEYNGKTIPVDPYIRLNSFTIHWGWGGIISGTSYNIYVNFTAHLNAENFVDWAGQALEFDDLFSTLLGAAVSGILGFVGIGAGSFIAAAEGAATVVESLGADLSGSSTPIYDVESNLNYLFQNEWAETSHFRLVFTLNAWEWGLVPEYAVWGITNPGNHLFEVLRELQPLGTEPAQQWVTNVYNNIAQYTGINSKTFYAFGN